MFDPLLIAIQVARDARNKSTQFGWLEGENYRHIEGLSVDRLQSLVDATCHTIGLEDGPRISQRYVDDFTLEIPQEYLHCDDHELESLVLEAVPEFNRFGRHAGDLLRHCASTTMTELPQFIPHDLFLAFQQLLTAEL